MAGGADTSTMHSSSISRLMSRSNLTGDPNRHDSLQPDLMSLRIDREINSMEKSLSSSKPLSDYSVVKEFDLYRGDPVCKDVDPSEINGSPFQTSDVKPGPSLLSSGMAYDQSDPSKMASKMDVKPKSATSGMESKMAATNDDYSKVTSSEAKISKRNSRRHSRHSRHSHERRSKSVSSLAIEEPPVTSKKTKKGKKSRRKSRESSISMDNSSTEESPVRKTKERQRSKRRKHR